jgi:hypothetical protein
VHDGRARPEAAACELLSRCGRDWRRIPSARDERNATRADVIKAFGSNAVDQKVRRPEGERDRATELYPKDAKRRLEITWGDQKARRRPTIRITGESTWSTASGLSLGLTLADIERMNGKPFRLYGYEQGAQEDSDEEAFSSRCR